MHTVCHIMTIVAHETVFFLENVQPYRFVLAGGAGDYGGASHSPTGIRQDSGLFRCSKFPGVLEAL